LLITAAAMATGLAHAPAFAQDEGGDRINQVIIFGDDECPVSEGDTITVCARLDESERYRIPPMLRESNSPDKEAWASRAKSFEAVGDFGPLSCTAVGTGAELGCTMQMVAAAYEERATGSDVRFSQLIEEERAARLAEIDAEAAATQSRVEELERAYMERLERERDAEIDGVADPAPPPAEIVDSDRLPPADLPPPSFDDDDQAPRELDAAPPPANP
jgi:hypothetical protein